MAYPKPRVSRKEDDPMDKMMLSYPLGVSE